MKTKQAYTYYSLVPILLVIINTGYYFVKFTPTDFLSLQTIIHMHITVHTLESFVLLSLFLATMTFFTQYTGREILFGRGRKRSLQMFMLLIFSRYIMPLLFIQYLLPDSLSDTNYIIKISTIICYLFSSMMLHDLIVYILRLRQSQLIPVRLFRWRFYPCVDDLFRLQGFTTCMFLFMLLCRQFMTCEFFIDHVLQYSATPTIASVPPF